MLKEYNPYLEYKDGELHLEGVSLKNLAKEYGTPLYVYSASYIRDRVRAYRRAFPEALICYAVKANFNPSIITLAKEEGAGADVVSGGELYLALKAGVDPSKIVYAGVGKTVQEIEFAVKQDILMFNVESSMELDVLNDVGQSLGKKVRIAIRVNPDVDPKTHPYISTGMKKSKFGIDIKQAKKEYEYARKLKNLEIVGIHCHIGSQILDVSPYIEAVEKVVELYWDLSKSGFDIKYLDLGGGLGIKYQPDQANPEPEDLAHAIMPSLKDVKAQIILEPGRSIVGNGGILITQVQFLKDKGHKHFVIVDAGMNDLIRPAIYSAYHHIVPVVERNSKYIKTDVVGPICETGDFLALDREIPYVERGDYLAVLSAGAYGFAMSSQYNARPRACEVLVEKGSVKVIRKRETYEDIIYSY
ncbi:diaminopimelate decarboxylase [Thermocrinis jamiesonii]|uniref:diaminopimelate decarboxylase n=1 Tax=Thermocrinis jamiesonii TaxID=1302351 RepID=UPI000495E3BC|nr:diaminopimelate decarboxylase [Thermocrinis jamiesonii]